MFFFCGIFKTKSFLNWLWRETRRTRRRRRRRRLGKRRRMKRKKKVNEEWCMIFKRKEMSISLYTSMYVVNILFRAREHYNIILSWYNCIQSHYLKYLTIDNFFFFSLLLVRWLLVYLCVCLCMYLTRDFVQFTIILMFM